MTEYDLRPLRLGEILDRTFSLYRRYFLLFIGISGIPRLLSLAVGFVQLWSHPGRPYRFGALDFGLMLLSFIVAVVVYLLAQGGTVVAVSEIYLGRTTSIATALRRAWEELGTLFGVVTLNGLATGAALLAFLIPGIYVGCRLLVCVPAALIEGRTPGASLGRSWNLTQGYAGRSFVIVVIYTVITLGVIALVQVPMLALVASARFNADLQRIYLALNQVVMVGAGVLIAPIFLISAAVFYFDLRVRKEAFDLQFMMDPTSERAARGGDSVPSILS